MLNKCVHTYLETVHDLLRNQEEFPAHQLHRERTSSGLHIAKRKATK